MGTGHDGHITLKTEVDTSGINKGCSSMKNGIDSIKGELKKLATVIGVTFSVTALIQFSKEAGKTATTTEASVQRLIDIYGKASDSVGDFIDVNARALGMSKASAAQFASIYGNLFSVWADQATNAELTNQYLNATAVVASKTGRTVEDVQERIRSGLLGNTEAIEDLGIFVNVKTIEMTAAFKRMANGKSWEQLDAYTQQQIRTMAILEQATEKYGTEVADTTTLTRARHNAAYEDFKNTWGKVVNYALMPVLKTLTKVFDYSTAALQAIFNISGKTINFDTTALNEQEMLIAGAVENQNALTEAVEETTAAQEKSLAGFDDLNVLSTGNTSDTVSTAAEALSNVNMPKLEVSKSEVSPLVDFLEKVSVEAIPSTKALERLGKSLEPLKTFSGKALKDFYNEFLKPIAKWSLGEGFPEFCDITAEWAASTNWSRLNSSLEKLWVSLSKFSTSIIGQGLLWFYQNVISPLIMWATENLIPGALDAISAGIECLGEIIDAASPTLEDFWNDFLVPIRDFIWEQTINFLNRLTDAFERLSDWASKNPEAVQKIADIVLKFLAGIWVYKTTKKLIDFLTALGSKFVEFGNCIAKGGLQSAFTAVAIGILAAGVLTLIQNWDKMSTLEKTITILGGLAAAATTAAIAIGVFHTAWSVGVAAAAIAAGLATLGLSFAFSDSGEAKKNAESTANSFYKSYDWNSTLELPKLARGAVIPANKEFLAVLGDQKYGRNLEAPEDLIRQIVREESGGHNFTVTATGSMAQLIRLLRLEIQEENTRATIY